MLIIIIMIMKIITTNERVRSIGSQFSTSGVENNRFVAINTKKNEGGNNDVHVRV